MQPLGGEFCHWLHMQPPGRAFPPLVVAYATSAPKISILVFLSMYEYCFMLYEIICVLMDRDLPYELISTGHDANYTNF